MKFFKIRQPLGFWTGPFSSGRLVNVNEPPWGLGEGSKKAPPPRCSGADAAGPSDSWRGRGREPSRAWPSGNTPHHLCGDPECRESPWPEIEAQVPVRGLSGGV